MQGLSVLHRGPPRPEFTPNCAIYNLFTPLSNRIRSVSSPVERD